MVKNIKNSKGYPLYALLLVVFCFVSAVGTTLYFLNKMLDNIQHERKWSDYDDCGIF